MTDADKRFHEQWLGMAQPSEGLVVSIPVLVDAQCAEKHPRDAHIAFLECLYDDAKGRPRIAHLDTIFARVLDLAANRFDRDDSLPENLSLYVPEGKQLLRPTLALRAAKPREDASSPADNTPAAIAGRPYTLLVWDVPAAVEYLDKPETTTGSWDYPAQAKFERLLRECRVPIGLLSNGYEVRLVYAPHGESSGWIAFRVADMASVSGRPLFDAFVMLLSRQRFFSVAADQQLPAILAESRKRNADVTNELSRQVFEALEVLLAGFSAAEDRDATGALRAALDRNDDHLYAGLLTLLLRLVFLLYCEDWGLLPMDNPLFAENYSILGLFGSLQADAGKYPDTMFRRFGAYPRLIALFRAVFLGVEFRDLFIPPRRGELFDPNRFPFLEGWGPDGSAPITQPEARAAAKLPSVDDGTIHSVLEKLLSLGGQRLSYRSLDVEQIGSVYEALMGFSVRRIESPAVRIKLGSKKGSARVWVEADPLLAMPANQRQRWLQDELAFDKATSEKIADAIKAAKTPEAISLALEGFSGRTPERARAGTLVIQPGPERRRTSSHYTPRALTEPIVARTLEPLIKAMGDNPSSETLLNLVICDPAVGSGAFLVAACRYLADHVVAAWTREGVWGAPHPLTPSPTPHHGVMLRGEGEKSVEVFSGSPSPLLGFSGSPSPRSAVGAKLERGMGGEVSGEVSGSGALEKFVNAHEDIVNHARRLVAQRCLYGVDKNTYAVQLARLSLWLVTMARNEPFTFVDHAIRHGDSLVGLSFDQIKAFHWKAEKQLELSAGLLKEALDEAIGIRRQILDLAAEGTYGAQREKERLLFDAEDALGRVRLIADLVVGAFFSQKTDKDRDKERIRRLDRVDLWLRLDKAGDYTQANTIQEELRGLQAELRAEQVPFHWMIEFPEVFGPGRADPLDGNKVTGSAWVDAFVGNPPFLGGRRIRGELGDAYTEWLGAIGGGSLNADVSARFFRKAAQLVGEHGAIGLLATNTIAQGDTREVGLEPLVRHERFTIYDAIPSMMWPGDANVTVAVVCIAKGRVVGFVGDPCLDGVIVSSINSYLTRQTERQPASKLSANDEFSFQGCVLAPNEGFVLTPQEREKLIAGSSHNSERIWPFLGGEEVNSKPDHGFDRYAIYFAGMTLDECSAWPDLLSIVEARAKPIRDKAARDAHRKYWWHYADKRPALHAAIAPLSRCLVTAQVTKHLCFSFQPTNRIFSQKLYAFPLDRFTAFATLQCRLHIAWTWLLSSTMKEDLSYTPSMCFETFPFPAPDPRTVFPALETIGETLYTTRAQFMIDTNQGLTKTYNALKDPACDDPRILHLRGLHEAMDRAVLDAYGWNNIHVPPYCALSDEDRAACQAFEDEVIDKLFVLNAQRAEEEKKAAALQAPAGKTPRKTAAKKEAATSTTADTASAPIEMPADKPKRGRKARDGGQGSMGF